MKLFGSRKTPSRLQEKSRTATDGAGAVPEIKNKITASFLRIKADKKRAAVISSYAAAALILIVLFVTVGSRVWEKDDKISDKDTQTSESDTQQKEEVLQDVILPFNPSDSTADEMVAVNQGETEGENKRIESYRNFLLAVYDNKGVYIDTLIIGRLDKDDKKLDLVTVPRDALVNISESTKKISNMMLSESGDVQRFANEISSITGFTFDYYASITPQTVEKIVDAAGGIYYVVPIPMQSSAEGINIFAGLQWLNGDKVQHMLKFTSGYPTGDIGRLETVHDFLLEFLSMYISGSEGPELSKLIEILAEDSEGNINEEVLREFADILYDMDGSNIRFVTMPGKNVKIRSNVYYEVAAVEWAEMINEYLNPYEQEILLHNLDILMYDDSAKTVMSTCGEMVDYNSFN